MSPQGQPDTTETASQVIAWLKARQEEIRSLQLSEQYLARIEQTASSAQVQTEKPAALTEAVEKLHQEIGRGNTAQVVEARDTLSSELQFWRLTISRRDARITAAELRRFCSRRETAPDTQTLAALVRFYRSLTHISQAWSKYDLVTTRLFALRDEKQRLRLRFNREQIITHLRRMSATWDESAHVGYAQGMPPDEAAARFAEFISELNGLTRLDEMINCRLLDRLRAFKSSLGQTFYLPEITAAAIECNVAVSARFTTLLEQENFHPASEPLREVIELISNTSVTDQDHSEELLQEEIRRFAAEAGAAEQAQLERLPGLIRLNAVAIETETAPPSAPEEQSETTLSSATEVQTEANADAEPVTVAESSLVTAFSHDASVLEETLEQIENNEANRVILTMIRHSSSALQQLDLRMFLSAINRQGDRADESAELRRHALTLIISVDHLLNARADEDESEENREEKFSGLLAEVGQAIATVQATAEEVMQSGQPAVAGVLDHINQCLRQSHQTLQSAIYDHRARQARRQAAAAAQSSSAAAAQNRSTAQPILRAATEAVKKYKWLVTVTVVIVAFGLFTQFSAPDQQTAVKRDPEVQVIELTQIPNGELLKTARARRGVMICLVSEKWSMLSDEDRREKLKAWQAFGQTRGVRTITLIDGRGLSVGSATQNQIIIHNS